MNTLTDEQLQQIADNACIKVGILKAEAMDLSPEDLQAFTKTVIDLALSKMAEGETDVVLFLSDFNGMPVDICKTANQRCRQAMAALRAQMQGEIDRLKACEGADAMLREIEKLIPRNDADRDYSETVSLFIHALREQDSPAPINRTLVADRDQWKARAEAAQKELAALKQQAPAGREAWLTENLDRIAEKASQTYPTDNWSHMGNDEKNDWRAVVKVVAAALAHKQPWIPCSERMPSREDGYKGGDVLWRWTALDEVVSRKWDWQHRHHATHWMPIPPLPTAPTAEKVPTCPKCHGDGYVEIQSGPYNRPCPLCKPAIPQGGESIDAIDQVPKEKVPTPPEGCRLASGEERKRLPVGSKCHYPNLGGWVDVGTCGKPAAEGVPIACPNTPPLVSFTNGKINPPPYGRWHRSDWTPEMLPEGWRPLLLGEKNATGDECVYKGGWHTFWQHTGTVLEADAPMRTRRPLPPAPEKEKEPEWVPLEACDVPPGSVIRSIHRKPEGDRWGLVHAVNGNGLVTADDTFRPWNELTSWAEISRDNGKTWEPCKKIKQS